MTLLFLKKFWKELLLAVALIFVGYMVYDKIYERGFEKSQQEHRDYVKKYSEDLDIRIDKLEQLSANIVEQNMIAAQNRDDDLKKILKAAAQKSLVVYKDGKCTPSQEFLDSYNSIINRANSK